ncbi:hypothetical protein QM012_002517 [Aureobasidium pullulans]|uniref:Uncharacterized protein n=1 Tax=Aureobasidium pullulans TaxID=5580 RepID=A0ABR0TC54_AURPU
MSCSSGTLIVIVICTSAQPRIFKIQLKRLLLISLPLRHRPSKTQHNATDSKDKSPRNQKNTTYKARSAYLFTSLTAAQILAIASSRSSSKCYYSIITSHSGTSNNPTSDCEMSVATVKTTTKLDIFAGKILLSFSDPSADVCNFGEEKSVASFVEDEKLG